MALDLRVDDGYVTRPAEKIDGRGRLSRGKTVLKLSPIIGVGNSRVIDQEGMWVTVRIIRVDDDADERLPSIDESQARETD